MKQGASLLGLLSASSLGYPKGSEHRNCIYYGGQGGTRCWPDSGPLLFATHLDPVRGMFSDVAGAWSDGLSLLDV